MQLKTYELYSNRVDLFFANGNMLRLWLNEWSGKVVFRYKINTISNIKHPGIVLGYDDCGTWYYMHNHFEHGHAVIEVQSAFAKGQPLYIEKQPSTLSALAIIENGLNEIIQLNPYEWMTNNCQCFVNRICYNKNRSESVENWAGGILAMVLLAAGIRVLSRSKY